MFNILVVDDEDKIRSLIRKYAEFSGHRVSEAQDGAEAVTSVKNGDFDLIIMDVMMPEMDGFTAMKEIRKFSEIPVIMLSARGEEYDIIHGFDLGVDDYVVKPFSSRELMMRIDAIMKRVGKTATTKSDIFTKDGLTVDFTARRLLVDGTEVQISPKEYDLLFYLVRNRGIALEREKILTEVWGFDFFGDDRTLDT
ncbi:MAG: response regulator transcription factor, partial [Clostridiaceae bacterium]